MAALQWTALSDDDTTIAAGVFDPGIRGIRDYMDRMRQYVVPMQSMVLADADGNIGMIAPGRVPVRDPANKVAGRAPVPGWDATYDWKGYLKFEDLPRVENPPSGAIGTANARIVGPTTPITSPTTGTSNTACSASSSSSSIATATTWPACARRRPTCSRAVSRGSSR